MSAVCPAPSWITDAPGGSAIWPAPCPEAGTVTGIRRELVVRVASGAWRRGRRRRGRRQQLAVAVCPGGASLIAVGRSPWPAPSRWRTRGWRVNEARRPRHVAGCRGIVVVSVELEGRRKAWPSAAGGRWPRWSRRPQQGRPVVGCASTTGAAWPTGAARAAPVGQAAPVVLAHPTTGRPCCGLRLHLGHRPPAADGHAFRRPSSSTDTTTMPLHPATCLGRLASFTRHPLVLHLEGAGHGLRPTAIRLAPPGHTATASCCRRPLLRRPLLHAPDATLTTSSLRMPVTVPASGQGAGQMALPPGASVIQDGAGHTALTAGIPRTHTCSPAVGALEEAPARPNPANHAAAALILRIDDAAARKLTPAVYSCTNVYYVNILVPLTIILNECPHFRPLPWGCVGLSHSD